MPVNNRVEKFVAELVSLTNDLCPEAEVKVSTFSLEGEDATLEVFVPCDKTETVNDALVSRSYDILLEEGYHIVVMIFEKDGLESRVAEAMHVAA